ncbi:aspartate aminotransferase family protein [Janthinobacterium agaricidamnosum]|uniref:Diaminobutyrate--2-oxoglutarate transaminase n=1 Tax=Janthinobacterium agaricidamnosum NBRC 102515 = DSM 9628 TaxID=1349767 RepID=W0V108_9BURK|nr:aspartate aminotransferase family protein [Janthinobacterium agaricidamnosum]CDG82504.1 aminotransferase class-III family protein [Janthinobacterium agaricidamnosum NBRC 102515 = DSM 9628]
MSFAATSHVFHRHLRAAYPTAVRGEGIYLVDSGGKRYLDASGGAAVSCLGHSDAAVIAALREQAGQLAYAHSSFFTTEPMEQLADFLVERAPQGIDSVYFVSGGSEAVETALKLARQYFVERGEGRRRHVIARRQSYHGNTLGALAAGGNAWRRKQFDPLLIPVEHIAPCYAYRDRLEGESDADYVGRLAQELEDTIARLGADNVLAFIAEPVVGATLGAVPALPGYLRRMAGICRRHGVLLILDEVMCGMGRTGTLFACEQDGVTADLICIAKGLGAGYQPIGAVLVSGQIRDTIRDGSGFFQHGHTYIGHATACAAALAVQRQVEQRGLLARVNQQGAALEQRLRARFGGHPHVGDIRGRGLFYGLEMVRDRATKAPFDPALKLHARIKQQAMDAGLMCYPMGGTLDGARGDHILLAPPFIVDEAQLDEIVDLLALAIERALDEVLAGATA